MELIEGVGNEVTVCFVCLSTVLAVCLYKFISQWQTSSTTVHQSANLNAQSEGTAASSATETSSTPGSLYELGRRGSYDEPREGALEITVKYREQSRTVFIPDDRTLLDLKRFCFQKVLDEGKRVHMVYQGHLLRPDTAYLSEFTLDVPASVICQISHSTASSNLNSGGTSPDQGNTEFDISGILLPLLGIILVSCWLLAMSLTSSISTTIYLALLFLSVLYVIALLSSIT